MIMTSVAFLIALALVLLLGVPYLEFMKKKMYGQYLKEKDKILHENKTKTPTSIVYFSVAAINISSITALYMAQ